jgi:hypothetical protein
MYLRKPKGCFIIFGGFQYITSAGDSTKVGQAKETITNALIALFLVLGSYTLFYFIDPELVQFKHLKIKVVQNVPLPDTDIYLGGEDIGSYGENLNPNKRFDIVDIPLAPANPLIVTNLGNGKIRDGSVPRLNSEAVERLKTAALKLSTATDGQAKIQINSGFRSWDRQRQYYEANCVGKPACDPPTCKPRSKGGEPIANCPHTSAQAIDVVCAGKRSDDPCQNDLTKAMRDAGFCQLSTEAWHFEYPALSPKCIFSPEQSQSQQPPAQYQSQ